ncbi:MAG: efflux RND transporter periplasmic adaptor subunit, partial [Oscillospiraceae bacterium]|nr:efflux RND transporter periplasmic adaptor subunit [Oscillospiraceae bacterium]
HHAEGVLTLPVDCVRFEDNRAYIYLEKEGFAQKTFVTLGMTDEAVYEITSGLTAADRVISTWHPNLTDGAAVAVQ